MKEKAKQTTENPAAGQAAPEAVQTAAPEAAQNAAAEAVQTAVGTAAEKTGEAGAEHVWPAAEETAKALTAAEETDKAAGAESAEAFEGLTPEERGVVLRYAVGDPEIRKTIIAEYLREVKAGAERAAPRVLSGSEGATPVLPPRNPRSLYEAGQIAEAIFSRS